MVLTLLLAISMLSIVHSEITVRKLEFNCEEGVANPEGDVVYVETPGHPNSIRCAAACLLRKRQGGCQAFSLEKEQNDQTRRCTVHSSDSKPIQKEGATFCQLFPAFRSVLPITGQLRSRQKTNEKNKSQPESGSSLSKTQYKIKAIEMRHPLHFLGNLTNGINYKRTKFKKTLKVKTKQELEMFRNV